MYDHIGLKVKDLAASIRFYEAALKPLGLVLCSRDDASAGFGPEDAPGLWLLASRTRVQGVHIAFGATDRKAVDRFYTQGLQHGGKENGAPGVRADYAPTYYAAFLLDPDGNNVEAVCLR